jgi:rhamnogalacturonan endolyase
MPRAIAAFACWTVLSLIVARPAAAATAAKVTLTQDQTSYTLDNGIVAAQISKTTGDLVSLKYEKLELLGGDTEHPSGHWRSGPPDNAQTTTAITIDPDVNKGQRAEVMVRGTILAQARGPAAAGGGQAAPEAVDPSAYIIDSEVRYCLASGDRGIYTYQSLVHHAGYRQFAPPQGDFTLRLSPAIFDRISIDGNRDKLMPSPAEWNQATPLNIPQARRIKTGAFAGQVECGFDYDSNLFETRVWGWAGSGKSVGGKPVGVWIINPSVEYVQGPPASSAPTVYRNEADGAPILVNHWCGDIGAQPPTQPVMVGDGQTWSKVIGPFFIYCNKGERNDAVGTAIRETESWPYDWVKNVDYSPREERGTVRGQLVFKNPPSRQPDPPQFVTVNQNGTPVVVRVQYPLPPPRPPLIPDEAPMKNLLVGLVPHVNSKASFDEAWQHDARSYQFWARGDSDGQHFVIPNVRPGLYDLYATADGVLGPYITQLVSIRAGQISDLGRLDWTPTQYGEVFWEIGIPTRSGDKFFRGNTAHHWGAWQLYPTDFPSGVNFIAQQSDYHKAWNYQQPPGSTWHIKFKLYTMQPGTRTWLRMALAGGSENAKLRVAINNHEITASEQSGKNIKHRLEGSQNILHGEVSGYWEQRVYPITSAQRSAGDNVIDLNVEGPSPTDGIIYDYLNFEIDEPFVPPQPNPLDPNQQPGVNELNPNLPGGAGTGNPPPAPTPPPRPPVVHQGPGAVK